MINSNIKGRIAFSRWINFYYALHSTKLFTNMYKILSLVYLFFKLEITFNHEYSFKKIQYK